MTAQNILVILSPDKDSEESLIQALKSWPPEHIYTLFTPTKTTTVKDHETITKLRQQSNLPENHHLTIPISSLVAKTWRLIHHYNPSLPAPEKGTPDRKVELKKITAQNQTRLKAIEESLQALIAQDQATRIDAIIMTPSTK